MKNKQIFTLAAALLVGLSSCSKENTVLGTEASKATFSLSFTLPTLATKATNGGDLNATSAESTVSSVHVFVFTSTGDKSSVGGYTSFDVSDFTPSGNVYQLNSDKNIETLSGEKRIYVGINLPVGPWNSYVTENNLLTAVETVSNMIVTDHFTMFSDAKGANLQSEEVLGKGVANMVVLDIRRVTAKIATSSSESTYSTEDWTWTGLTMTYTIKDFRVIQNAFNSYVAPNYRPVTPPAPAKTHIDDFTLDNRFNVLNTFTMSANATPTSIVHPHPGNDADIVAMGGFYVGENAPQVNTNGNTTYAMVATTVTCNKEAVWDATADGGIGSVVWRDATYGGGVTGSDVYVVHYNGNDYVCSDYDEAQELGLSLDGNTGESKIYTYKDGYVHFVVWLNKNGDNDYSVLRNQFIHIKINGVTDIEYLFPGYPGDPNDPTKPIDPTDPTNPENPDPKKPDGPVDPMKTFLQVEVTVKPWTYMDNSTILQ